METIFYQLGIILLTVTVLGGLMRMFKQPLVLAYLLSGIFIGSFALFDITETSPFATFAQIGVALLLFLVGMNLNTKVLKEVGKPSLLLGIGQVLFTTVIGYLIVRALGFPHITAFYIGIALSFSSTIIIVKLLSDKNDLESLYGKISVGVLLIQDLIVIIILIMLVAMSTSQGLATTIPMTLFKGLVLFAIAYFFHKYALPPFFEKTARQQEYLFISAITWCFALALVAVYFGFSIEIGALLAGVALAGLPYTREVMSKIKPLRDFFLILFFIVLGAKMSLSALGTVFWPAVLLSLFVLIGNPLIVMVIMSALGFTSRTGFLAGLTVAQISEFSLILVLLGNKLGHVGPEAVNLITLVGLITIAVSTYLITFGNKIFERLEPYLSKLERKNLFEKKLAFHTSKRYDLVLLGYHRVGYNIIKKLHQKKTSFIVVDYNPLIVKELMEKGVSCLYGDIAHSGILEHVKKYKSKVIISTIHQLDDNLLIAQFFKRLRKKPIIILTANTIQESLSLYEEGADYVILPHMLGGEKAGEMLQEVLKRKHKIKDIRNKHIKHLLDMDLPMKWSF